MKTLLLALLLVGCAQTPKEIKKHNLVLIQGVHLDASSWDGVKKHLNPEEFTVTVVDRAGRDDKGPASLRNIAERSCALVLGPSTIVAHSYGGAIANAMVGTCPMKIRGIIYISGVVPLHGEKPFDLMNKTDNLGYSKIVTFGKFKIIPKEALTFYRIADPYIPTTALLPPLYAEWVSLGAEDVTFDPKVFSGIPKSYIYTEKDPLIGLTTQFQYTSRSGIKNYDGIATGHFPMLSNPEKLTQLITKWAKYQLVK
jgi:pimeloyl-ACP methyl ester carboxylesterase